MANTVPAFCAHEHWGSFAAIGSGSRGFKADLSWGMRPSREAGLLDLLLDPYFGGNLAAAGLDAGALAKQAGFDDVYAWGKQAPEEAFATLRPHLAPHRLTGAYQSLRRGILALYGTDIASCDGREWTHLDAQVGMNYGRIFAWYREAMSAACFTQLIRPMWPELHVLAPEGDAAEHAESEREFTYSVMRVDAFMDMYLPEHPRRDALAGATGVDPCDAASWRAFLEAVFEAAERDRCIGTKQAQAYKRPLAYPETSDGEVVWRGELDHTQRIVFQSWVMNECFRLTEERGWPHQCHVGTHNLPDSQPLPLAGVAHRYPGMKLVMLHCWPYLDEAGYLAKQMPNVYIDACWQVILSQDFPRRAFASWLGYVPLHKLTCSQDATSVEMAVGACSLVREILDGVLKDRASVYGVKKGAEDAAVAEILQNNAVRLYGPGETV